MTKVQTIITSSAALAGSGVSSEVITNETVSIVVQILIGVVTLFKLLKKSKRTPKD